MQIYPENYDVTVGLGFTDLNGAAVEPTAVKAVLYDGDDQIVVDFGSLPFDIDDGRKDIVIPASFNVLGDDELEAARILRMTLVTAAGEIRRSSSYIIQGEIRLELMSNSFVTLEAAELIARNIPNLVGWMTATPDQQYAALINSFNRLTRIPMKFQTEDTSIYYAGRDQRCQTETVIPAQAWSSISADEFLGFPAHFRKAVRMAQVAEANDLLENDVTERRHRQGIISESVGESTIMLRGGRLNLGVSSRCLEYLTGYVYYNFRVARA